MAQIPSPMHPEARRTLTRLAEISGQNVNQCMQCGTCSAVCPMVESMGITTRQGMLLLQWGRAEAVMDARIGEFCASCHACLVRCPRGIDVPRVFEGVRLLALRDNRDLFRPEDVPEDVREDAPQIALVSSFRKLTA
jgi:heterodisulfide reductase subunit C